MWETVDPTKDLLWSYEREFSYKAILMQDASTPFQGSLLPRFWPSVTWQISSFFLLQGVGAQMALASSYRGLREVSLETSRPSSVLAPSCKCLPASPHQHTHVIERHIVFDDIACSSLQLVLFPKHMVARPYDLYPKNTSVDKPYSYYAKNTIIQMVVLKWRSGNAVFFTGASLLFILHWSSMDFFLLSSPLFLFLIPLLESYYLQVCLEMAFGYSYTI